MKTFNEFVFCKKLSLVLEAFSDNQILDLLQQSKNQIPGLGDALKDPNVTDMLLQIIMQNAKTINDPNELIRQSWDKFTKSPLGMRYRKNSSFGIKTQPQQTQQAAAQQKTGTGFSVIDPQEVVKLGLKSDGRDGRVVVVRSLIEARPNFNTTQRFIFVQNNNKFYTNPSYAG
jgi:hypothetical protein